MPTCVTDVTVEHHREPTGIGTGSPRLSWRVRSDTAAWRQAAYEIEIMPDRGQGWVSGRTPSAQSVLVDWEAPALVSREARSVRVRVWGAGDTVPTPWSAPMTVEAGLLYPADWRAELALPPMEAAHSAEQPGHLLRRDFTLPGRPVRARLYATAHGVYEAEINGAAVGDHLLAPGWTSYPTRLRYQTFDVTHLLRAGANTVGVHVADGWYRGHLGFSGQRALYGDRIGAAVQLEVVTEDGAVMVITTDGAWRCARSHVVSADLYNGQCDDLRLAAPGWSTPGFDAATWQVPELRPLEAERLVAPTGPPVRRIETVRPVAVTMAPSGAALVDFGVNLVGRVRLNLPDAAAGTRVQVRHAEVLEHEELGVRPLRAARATDTVLLDGRGARSWEPQFTVHGFRYAEVTGWPGTLTTDDLKAVVVHTDLLRTGTFSCSEPDLATLHENVVRSMRGNFVDLPTDCPQRDERLGWTGDLAVFCATAAFLYDTTGMLTSWLRDLAAEQRPDGLVLLFVPDPGIRRPAEFPVQAEAGWGDAAVIVPWQLYLASGDTRLLDEQWPSMTAWLDAFERRAGAALDFPDGGFMFGDWLDPTAPDDQPWAAQVPWQLVATAYLARSARLVAKIADVTGRTADAARYGRLHERAVARFQDAYLTPDGRLSHRAQTAYALALDFGLLTEENVRAQAGADLADQVASDGHHIASGFLGTPHVLPALTRSGHLAEAYRLLLQRTCPSWLYPVSMGATTVWERWNSMLPDGSVNPGEMTSFNHYAFGAVADWLHGTVAGLAPAEPGYRRLLVAPRPGGGLTHAAADLLTPYGPASVAWTLHGGEFALHIEVPANADADVHLPDGSPPVAVGSGRHHFSCRLDADGDHGSHREHGRGPGRRHRPEHRNTHHEGSLR